MCIVRIDLSESAEILGCSFRNNTGLFFGGALVAAQTNRTDVIGCNFEDNTSRDGSGGSIEFQFAPPSSPTRVGVALVSESNFANSFAPFDGGAIFSRFPRNVTVEGSTFTNCVSTFGAACT